MKALLFLASTCCLFAEEKTYSFAGIFAPQELQEVATVVRSITDAPQVSLEDRTLKLGGAGQQIAAAEWIARELDRPTGAIEYTFSDDDRIRIFTFISAKDNQDLQEGATLVRVMCEIRRLFTFSAPRKIVMRGTRQQIEQASWILNHLPGNSPAGVAEMKVAIDRDPILRIYTLPQFPQTQRFQQAVVTIRSIAEIRYAFTYNSTRKLGLRGTADQMAMVDFLLKHLTPSPSEDRHRIAKQNDFVQVFDASKFVNVEDHAVTMRSMVDLRRVFAYEPGRKIVVRGSREELDYCEWMMQEGAGEFSLGLIRKFPLAFTSSIQELQEAATMLRSTGEIWRVLAENNSKTVFVRGTPAEIEFAEWLFGNLATPPASGQAERKFGTDVVKLFFLKPVDIPLKDFFDKVTQARRESRIPRVFTYNSLRAVVMRGTMEQIATAEALLQPRKE